MQAMTTERAVRRFLQIAAIEQTVQTIEAAIGTVQKEIEDAQERVHELQSQRREQLGLMRSAAKDEGQLPLFDVLAGELEAMGVPADVLPPSMERIRDDFLASIPEGSSLTMSTTLGAGDAVHIPAAEADAARKRVARRRAGVQGEAHA